jgi:hypothetical protein
VLAAAIRSGAQVIVTSNLRHFPAADLVPYSIIALSPDDFACRILDQSAEDVARVVVEQAASLRAPPVSTAELLATLESTGLSTFVGKLRTLRPELCWPNRP